MLALRLLAEGEGGVNTELLWLLWSILGLFVLAIIAGWLSSLRMPKQVVASHEADSSSANEKVHDDLSKIEGIGPKVVKVLARVGITSFEELATANVDDVQNTLNKAGLQMLNPEGWIDQAKLAVQGDWDGFEKLQKKLKGGRKKK